MAIEDLEIVIENPKGSYKSFDTDNDPVWKEYPLKGVTYPTEYGFIQGYVSEDGHDLDVFRGSGDLFGKISIWRLDVSLETKFALWVTEEEWAAILDAFEPVLKDSEVFDSAEDLVAAITLFKKNA